MVGDDAAGNRESINCVMAARRDDEVAQRNWLRMMADVDQAKHLDGVLLDRTSAGNIQRFLLTHGWNPDRSSLRIVRQSGSAPIREVWREINSLRANWLVSLADDDHWAGLSKVTPPREDGVALLTPRLMITDSTLGTSTPAPSLLPQHALHGLLRMDVANTISSYLSDAPTPWGGEDLLILFVAECMGSIVESDDFTYYWNSRNWQSDTQEGALMDYLIEAGWGKMANLSTYLLCQSLDRVAVASHARFHLDSRAWRSMVGMAMSQFWPVTSRRNHAAFRSMPGFVRAPILSSRGLSGLERLVSIAVGSVKNLGRSKPDRTVLERFGMGEILVNSVPTIRDELIPALRTSAPRATHQQIDYWSECVDQVAAHLALTSQT